MEQHAQGLWTADHTVRLAGGIPFPTRMTVVRDSDGGLALVSPVPVTDELAAELAALGEVRHILQPNRLHDLHLRTAAERYSGAHVVPASELVDVIRTTPSLADVLVPRFIQGVPKLEETVLLHPSSQTLVVTDFVFNVVEPPAWTTGLLLWTTGTRGRLAQSRVWRWSAKDRSLFEKSVDSVLELAFDRLVVAHGDVIETGARERLATVLGRGCAASLGEGALEC